MFSCTVGFVKPEKEIYMAVLENLGVPAQRCLFVGDGGNDELAGARSVGMHSAITLEFVSEPESKAVRRMRAQADFEITHIGELLTAPD